MIVTIKTALGHILPMLPIIGAGVVEQEGVLTKISTAGIFSRVIELALLGTIFLYTTVQVLDSKIDYIEEYLGRHEAKCEENSRVTQQLQTSILLMQQRQEFEELKRATQDPVFSNLLK